MKRATMFLAAAVIATFGMRTMPETAAQDKERTLTFEIYKDGKEEFRWRLKATNGAIIATGGQGYKAKADCEKGIELIKEGASKAKVVEAKEEKEMKKK